MFLKIYFTYIFLPYWEVMEATIGDLLNHIKTGHLFKCNYIL